MYARALDTPLFSNIEGAIPRIWFLFPGGIFLCRKHNSICSLKLSSSVVLVLRQMDNLISCLQKIHTVYLIHITKYMFNKRCQQKE